MKKSLLVTVGLVLAVGVVSQASTLLVNGSFEEGDAFAYPGYTSAVPGWSFTGAGGTNPAIGGAPFSDPMVPPDGIRVGFIQAQGGGISTMSQSVTLSAGSGYVLSWYEGKRPPLTCGGDIPYLTVMVKDSNGNVVQSKSSYVSNVTAFVEKSMTFDIATNGAYNIVFSNNGSQAAINTAYYTGLCGDATVALDDVQLVPEPITIGLLGLGFVGLIRRARS